MVGYRHFLLVAVGEDHHRFLAIIKRRKEG